MSTFYEAHTVHCQLKMWRIKIKSQIQTSLVAVGDTDYRVLTTGRF